MPNKVHLPFNKDFMPLRDMQRAADTLEGVVNRWHQRNEQFAKGEYDLAEFFHEVEQQIHCFTTRLYPQEGKE